MSTTEEIIRDLNRANDGERRERVALWILGLGGAAVLAASFAAAGLAPVWL